MQAKLSNQARHHGACMIVLSWSVDIVKASGLGFHLWKLPSASSALTARVNNKCEILYLQLFQDDVRKYGPFKPWESLNRRLIKIGVPPVETAFLICEHQNWEPLSACLSSISYSDNKEPQYDTDLPVSKSDLAPTTPLHKSAVSEFTASPFHNPCEPTRRRQVHLRINPIHPPLGDTHTPDLSWYQCVQQTPRKLMMVPSK